MNTPLRVVLLEDNPADAELILSEVKHAGYVVEARRAETEAEFAAALSWPPDLVIADYTLPEFDGARALAMLKASGLDAPFILVTGTVGEETAVAMIQQGAAAFALKANLDKVRVMVPKALQDAELRRENLRTRQDLKAEADFRTAIEDSIDAGLVSYDLEGQMVRVNQHFCDMIGAERDDLVGSRPPFPHWPPEDAENLFGRFKSLVLGDGARASFEARFLRRDGTRIDVTVAVSPIKGPDGQRVGTVGLIHDITQRKRTEEKFRLVVENSRDFIGLIDPQGHYTYANPAFKTALGYEPSELVGRSLLTLVQSKDRPAIEAVFAASMGSPAPQIVEADLVCADGQTKAFEVMGCWVRDAAGQPTQGILIGRDLSERRRLQSEVLQAQKMESIGALAGGVAHDFNNILMVISANATFLHSGMSDSDPRNGDIKEILDAAERAAGLTRQLLIFSRKQVVRPVAFDLDQLAANLHKMLRRILGEDIAIELVRSGEPAVISADPGQVEQVIMNLAVNARDAMRKGGRLTIKTSVVGETEAVRGDCHMSDSGRYARLEVTDTGCGMPPEVLQRLFEPFFTTKPAGKGTGLGLSTAYGIVRQARGGIAARSAVGKGTTFTVLFPLAGKEAVWAEASSEDDAGPRGQETVLIVEDEEPVRRIAERILADHGYTVLTARCGEEALELLRMRGPFALMITDVVMPGMSGKVLAAQAAALRPDLKFLFASGFSAHGEVEEILKSGAEFLQKPFKPSALARAVRKVLDAPAPALAGTPTARLASPRD